MGRLPPKGQLWLGVQEGGGDVGEEGERQGQFAPSKQAPGSPLSSDAAHQSRGPRAAEGDSRQGRGAALELVLDTYFRGCESIGPDCPMKFESYKDVISTTCTRNFLHVIKSPWSSYHIILHCMVLFCLISYSVSFRIVFYHIVSYPIV